jgi:hypothetical protein
MIDHIIRSMYSLAILALSATPGYSTHEHERTYALRSPLRIFVPCILILLSLEAAAAISIDLEAVGRGGGGGGVGAWRDEGEEMIQDETS